MKKELNIKTQAKFLDLKSTLNQVQDTSFQYMQLNKRIDVNDLSEEEALELIEIFEKYISDLHKVLREAINED